VVSPQTLDPFARRPSVLDDHSMTSTSDAWQEALDNYTALLPRLRDADDAAALDKARAECRAKWQQIEDLLVRHREEIVGMESGGAASGDSEALS
jgi:hypothetical protein